MRKLTTFNLGNITEQNNPVALTLFGFAEAAVAMLQASDWMHEYVWAVRILPFVALALSHTKLLFKTETIGGKKVAEIIAEEGADVEVIPTKQKEE
jgi:hypothetical protein